MDQVDLLKAFRSFDGFRGMMIENLLPALNDPNSAAVAFFALEGLFRIETEVESGQFAGEDVFEEIRTLLRQWRCESPLDGSYSGLYNRVAKFLRSLTIFRILEVPLFIDDYGTKRFMSHYIDIEPIPINLDTPIVHVTHTTDKDQIMASQKFIPNNNKNSIEGVWFSPTYQLGNPLQSVYGSWAFETTLRSLGVAGIRQGEIVSYKNEVNFILYASDTVPPDPVRKATDRALQLSQNSPYAYGAVSIFVPSRFLPQVPQQVFMSQQVFLPQQLFMQGVFAAPYPIQHYPFCVKEKRGIFLHCPDLIRS